MEKPAELFDRESEWRALAAFAADDTPGARLAVVRGRRRRGKSVLVRALAERFGGLYHPALEGSARVQLADLGGGISGRLGVPVELSDWSTGLDVLLGADALPRLVVLDEFSYLVAADPSLPSRPQRWLDGHARTGRVVRLVVCWYRATPRSGRSRGRGRSGRPPPRAAGAVGRRPHPGRRRKLRAKAPRGPPGAGRGGRWPAIRRTACAPRTGEVERHPPHPRGGIAHRGHPVPLRQGPGECLLRHVLTCAGIAQVEDERTHEPRVLGPAQPLEVLHLKFRRTSGRPGVAPSWFGSRSNSGLQARERLRRPRRARSSPHPGILRRRRARPPGPAPRPRGALPRRPRGPARRRAR